MTALLGRPPRAGAVAAAGDRQPYAGGLPDVGRAVPDPLSRRSPGRAAPSGCRGPSARRRRGPHASLRGFTASGSGGGNGWRGYRSSGSLLMRPSSMRMEACSLRMKAVPRTPASADPHRRRRRPYLEMAFRASARPADSRREARRDARGAARAVSSPASPSESSAMASLHARTVEDRPGVPRGLDRLLRAGARFGTGTPPSWPDGPVHREPDPRDGRCLCDERPDRGLSQARAAGSRPEQRVEDGTAWGTGHQTRSTM